MQNDNHYPCFLILAFLSGMEAKKRVLTNLIFISSAVEITCLIGLLVRTFPGIQILRELHNLRDFWYG